MQSAYLNAAIKPTEMEVLPTPLVVPPITRTGFFMANNEWMLSARMNYVMCTGVIMSKLSRPCVVLRGREFDFNLFLFNPVVSWDAAVINIVLSLFLCMLYLFELQCVLSRSFCV